MNAGRGETDATGASAVAGTTAQPVVNYFAVAGAAERYATGRPSGHARVLELLQRTLSGHLPVGRALDVGCGTGHSTIALLPYAQAVMGVDSSSEMLTLAPVSPRVQYRKGYAEALPFRKGEFDLVSVKLRVPTGSITICFWPRPRECCDPAAGWCSTRPDRSADPPGNRLSSAGDVISSTTVIQRWRGTTKRSRPSKPQRMDLPSCCRRRCITSSVTPWRATFDNLLTHSRVVRVVDGGHEPLDVARAWLQGELARFFQDGVAQFTHESRIHVLQRDVE